MFTKKINNDYKLIPFNLRSNNVGKTRYLPPVIKEWKNSVYNYNSKNVQNYPVYDLHVNSLIKGFFTMYFNNKFIQHRFIAPKSKYSSLIKIFVSKAEIKHTNSKAIITIYVYNKEKNILLENLYEFIGSIFFLLKKNPIVDTIFSKKKFLSLLVSYGSVITDNNLKKSENKLRFFSIIMNKRKNFSKKLRFLYFLKRLALNLYKWAAMLRKNKLRMDLNKYKFEDKLLFKLNNYISSYYGKKVEFNIVNIKSIAYNGDIFTEILTTKTRTAKNPMSPIYNMLDKVKLPVVNKIVERSKVENQVYPTLFENNYRNNSLSLIFNNNLLYKDNLNHLLNNIYSESNSNISILDCEEKDYLNIRDVILKNIKYKNMGGVRLIVKGRLTKRYRADRAICKLNWKGGLKNVDSAFKGLSTVLLRGHLDSNVEKSICVSKRRVGSFAVKGWFSGK